MHYYAEAVKKELYAKGMGFNNKQLNDRVLCMDNNLITSEYMDAFGAGISSGEKIEEIRVKNCSLSGENAIRMLAAMRVKNIKCLDFSMNQQLNAKFYARLGEQFDHPRFRLRKLYLEGNNMKDKSCELLCDQLQHATSLRILNLNENQLTDKSMFSVCQVVRNCPTLEELHLHYNQIFREGSLKLA